MRILRLFWKALDPTNHLVHKDLSQVLFVVSSLKMFLESYVQTKAFMH